MPTVERVRGRGLVRGIGRYGPGERAEVSEADAEYLVEENGDFEYVDDDSAPDEPDTIEDGEGGDADAEAEPALRFDPGDATDFAANGWLDNDYEDRAEAVLAGGLDAHLDAIEDAERSETVFDAVADRRAELEE